MTEWPLFESHKMVRAARIVSIGRDGAGSVLWVRPDGEEFANLPVERFVPTEHAMIARAEVGGVAMLYPDGYRSVSPAKQFDEGYTRVTLGD